MTSDLVKKQAVGRFAPSPTGPLHLGSLVTAVGSYLMAKRRGGRWLLRMEDLDTPRVVPGMADDILRTLEAFGLFWDGEIVWQSRRRGAYTAAFTRLGEKGVIYPCGCSRAEISRSSSAPHPGEEGPVYPGFCRGGLSPGKKPRAFRVVADTTPVVFTDLIQGEYRQNLAEASGDFVVKRADGPFAYHLAVVVDDAESGVTEIIRGADLLSSTPRQIYLQRLLGYPAPGYGHLPLVTRRDGGKLSKRDNAVSLAAGYDLTKAGGALLACALRFLGQDPPLHLADAPPSELVAWGLEHFSVARIPRAPSPFTGSDE